MRRLLLMIPLLLATAALGGWFYISKNPPSSLREKQTSAVEPSSSQKESAGEKIQLAPGKQDEVLVPQSVFQTLGIKLSPVVSGLPPKPLQLSGRLFIDSTRVARVHSRFNGEIVSLAMRNDPPEQGGGKRPIRYGDTVQQDEILAVVWSKEVGEKKSELIDALSRLRLNKSVMERLEKLEKGVVSERMIREAERNYEADQISVALAERTLRSWRLTEEEIEQLHQEAERLHERNMKSDPDVERQWAQVEIRAPFAGVLLEINAAPGVIVETTQELFKIANLNTLSVIAHVYEEDLPKLERLTPEQHKWSIEVYGATDGIKLDGEFGLIGEVIDPMQHTASIIGWVPNQDRKLRIGQFITATIPLPANPDEVAFPTTALLEDGHEQFVFVADKDSDEKFIRRPVEVTARNEDFICIRKLRSASGKTIGLNAGDRVVTAGVVELAAGLTNLLIEENSKPSAATPAKDVGGTVKE